MSDDGRYDMRRFMEAGAPVATEAPSELVFLASLGESDWRSLLAACEHRRYSACDVVLSEGELDRSLGILLEGRLAYHSGGVNGTPLNFVDAPTIIGEVAFFDGLPRSGSLVALTDVELFRLEFDAFESLAAQQPRVGRAILLDMGRVLALRLRVAVSPGSAGT